MLELSIALYAVVMFFLGVMLNRANTVTSNLIAFGSLCLFNFVAAYYLFAFFPALSSTVLIIIVLSTFTISYFFTGHRSES